MLLLVPCTEPRLFDALCSANSGDAEWSMSSSLFDLSSDIIGSLVIEHTHNKIR